MPPEVTQAIGEPSPLFTPRPEKPANNEAVPNGREPRTDVQLAAKAEITTNGAILPDDITPLEQQLLATANLLGDMYNANEDKDVLERKAEISQGWGGTYVLDQERGLAQLRIRSRQAVLDHTFTRIRIEELEKDLQKMKAVVYNLGDDWKPPHRDRFPVHRHEIARNTAARFCITTSSSNLPTTQQPALEVQISERATMTPLTSDLEGTADEFTCQPKSRRFTPDRLRIRSRPLLSHLERKIGGSIMDLARSEVRGDDKVYSGVVFLRPFKYFVQHHNAIRQSLGEVEASLKKELEKGPQTGSDPRAQNKERQQDQPKKFDNKDLLEDLKLLISFFDTDIRSTFDLRQEIKDGTATDIEYADLWHLFQRGDIVVTRSGQNHAYRVVNIAGGREPLSFALRDYVDRIEKPVRVDGFALDCISIGTDGSSYIPKLKKLSIKKYHGSQPITSLPVYPLRFDPNADSLRAKFLEGGRNFLDVTRQSFSHRVVKGRTLDEPSHDLEGQVIIDMTLAMVAKPEWRLQPSISVDDFTRRDKRETFEDSWCKHGGEGCCGGDMIFKDLTIDDLQAETFAKTMARSLSPLMKEDLSEEDVMLMEHYVHAFVLRSRQWVTVLTADLSDVVFENSFKDLVLPDKHGEMVRALVDTHENMRSSQSGTASIGSSLDLVKGKGTGLIILLHGPPGVGKTSTAECVADDTRRPLYPITCGDIGETAVEVEKSLQYNFRLAHKWGCVLLLDEADVFLAKRTRSDLRHNAVTSVFLRSLEYYAGILFLTTNRVGAMDPAFKSRIQVSLFYPKLDLDVTRELYKKFIKRAKDAQRDASTFQFKIKEKEILKFAKSHFRELEKERRDTWNGRQIRNAFQTAIALAEHQSKTQKPEDPTPILGREQFEMVASGFKKFDDYLVNILGVTEADAAKREGWRDDAFMAMPPHTHVTTHMMPVPAVQRPVYSTQTAQVGKQAVRDRDSDSSSDDSDSDSDSDSDEEEETSKREKARGAKGAAVAVPVQQVQPAAGPSFEQMQEFFMKFQSMQPKP